MEKQGRVRCSLKGHKANYLDLIAHVSKTLREAGRKDVSAYRVLSYLYDPLPFFQISGIKEILHQRIYENKNYYTPGEKPMEKNLFHKHLDKCLQCKNQPFNLCPVGQGLLQITLQGLKLPNLAPNPKDR